ncbi:MAG: cell division protein SepF [Candidatus Pacearchaeota archaeon]|nr:cell division protein SepF [Candidatus Pacearchaeota archaeon]
MAFFNKLFGGKGEESLDYIEVDIGRDTPKKSKVVLRPFVLRTFEDVGRILEILREGNTIALIDIKSLKSKDVIELKRSISKLKKTVDALEGNIAGFGENVIIVTPPFVDIFRGGSVPPQAPKTEQMM